MDFVWDPEFGLKWINAVEAQIRIEEEKNIEKNSKIA